MGIIRWTGRLKRALLERRETPRQTEIRRVKDSLKRHEQKLDDLFRAWRKSGGLCCPDCFSAGEYSRIAGKIGRIDAQLQRLLEKENRESMEEQGRDH